MKTDYIAEHPLKAFFPMRDIAVGRLICSRDEQPENADSSIEFSSNGVDTTLSDVQFMKVSFCTTVTFGGKFTCSSELQSLNALLPIETTESGMVIFFNERHPSKVPISIDSTDSGIEKVSIDEHL